MHLQAPVRSIWPRPLMIPCATSEQCSEPRHFWNFSVGCTPLPSQCCHCCAAPQNRCGASVFFAIRTTCRALCTVPNCRSKYKLLKPSVSSTPAQCWPRDRHASNHIRLNPLACPGQHAEYDAISNASEQPQEQHSSLLRSASHTSTVTFQWQRLLTTS